jgi:hypothetical protein
MSYNLQNKTNLFIEKAILKHGNKYDYSRVEYINSKTKVCIFCNNKDGLTQKIKHITELMLKVEELTAEKQKMKKTLEEKE